MHTNDLADMLLDAATELRGIEMHELASAVDTARARLTRTTPAQPEPVYFDAATGQRLDPQLPLALGGG